MRKREKKACSFFTQNLLSRPLLPLSTPTPPSSTLLKEEEEKGRGDGEGVNRGRLTPAFCLMLFMGENAGKHSCVYPGVEDTACSPLPLSKREKERESTTMLGLRAEKRRLEGALSSFLFQRRKRRKQSELNQPLSTKNEKRPVSSEHPTTSMLQQHLTGIVCSDRCGIDSSS